MKRVIIFISVVTIITAGLWLASKKTLPSSSTSYLLPTTSSTPTPQPMPTITIDENTNLEAEASRLNPDSFDKDFTELRLEFTSGD